MEYIKSFLLQYGLIYLLLISAVSAATTVADKIAAKRHVWRIPERTLFLFSILGGSVAMYLTMLAFRHKTKHKRFMVGIPVIFVIQAALLTFIFLN